MAKNNGIDNGVIANLGRQLTNKVQSGDLTRGQATKVKNQRQLLQKAFGDNWRVKVYGNKEGAKGIGGPFARGQIAADRSKALERAKAKLAVKTAGSPNNGSVEAPPKGINRGKERVKY